MEYSKQFSYKGITIMFDKIETDKNYPNNYILIRTGNLRPVAFIPKLKLTTDVITVSDTYKIVSFGFTNNKF